MFKRITKTIIFVAVITGVICLSACDNQKQPTLKHNDCELWHEELEGAKPKFVEDYIYMWDLLENEYPLLNTAERITGKNAEDIKERYYYKIPEIKNPSDFQMIIIDPCFAELGNSGHLYSWCQLQYSSLYKIWNINDCYKFLLDQITSESSKNYYKYAIEIAESEMEISEEMQKAQDKARVDNNLQFGYYPDKSTAYVHINQMSSPSSNDDLEDDPEFLALKKFFNTIEADEYKNCIIDIRDNPGGSTGYWTYGIVTPNISESINTNNYLLANGNTCIEYLKMYNTKSHPISQLPIDKLPNLNKDDLDGKTHYLESPHHYNPLFNNSPLFSGKFWVLTSSRNYSASEAFIVFCKQTGFASLVGTTTGGDGVGVQPIPFCLPNTGIIVQFSPVLGLNPDGSGSEEFGTTPDYEISEGEDALEYCLQLIENK